jgi:hypothetical protein
MVIGSLNDNLPRVGLRDTSSMAVLFALYEDFTKHFFVGAHFSRPPNGKFDEVEDDSLTTPTCSEAVRGSSFFSTSS